MAKFYTSAIAALVIAALAIFINEFADRFDVELNACGLGTFEDGACVCTHPYVGKHCETVDCGYGRIINSLFESSLITTPHPDSDIGCSCESQFWGYSCADCTSKYPSDCSGPCLDGFYGARCDIICKQGTASDAEGYEHEQAGGTYNYYTDENGICKTDGSVKCNIGRAGEHCEFQCLDCEYGSCDLTDGSCNCFAGYYGELCNATCPGRCSGNNGVCQQDGTCDCDAGFTGDDCSLTCCIRDGGTSLGRVHGSCDPLGGCLCDQDWSGDNCDCNSAITCLGRGTCNNVTGICMCEEQFQGARCEMCNDLKVGPFCQYDRYQCPSREQQNGEFVPINTRGDYACKCKAGFQGTNCIECTPSAYPKNGTEMCSFVIPASLCNRGTVKPTYQGTGIMCDCEQNFNPDTDCASCKDKYFGEDCQIFCDVDCTNSGGICEAKGCICPRGLSSVDGECVVCGGVDAGSDCGSGECVQGKCICDPGYYGDNCQVSAPIAEGKVCNGYQSSLYFENANCETDAECLDTSQPFPVGTSVSIANQAVAIQAQQFGREAQTFCHRLDTPIALKNTEGCCVDDNADGFCDADKLLEFPCSGEVVVDICNQRSLEGEVNVFEWCTSIQRGCTMNGQCADPVLCEDRCDDGMNSSEWIEKYEFDHIQSMESVMNESWKFPIHFDDPYNVRQFYYSASLDDVCPAPTGYNFCRDALIPPDATVFNATYKWVDEWVPMPSFHSCELDYHILKIVNGTYIYNFSTPIWAERIEMVSDPTETAAFGRLGQDDLGAAYYGNVSTYIDSIMLFGRGEVEVIIYNYTTDDCVDLMKRSASKFAQCKEYAFYEFEYDWDDFCTFRDTVVGPGGFEQRCYDQSLVCAGCEFWEEGCENLPLESEYPSPMPPPCTPWDNFCEDYLNVTKKQTGTCAYTECECEGYGVGGIACDLQCAVPQFLNSQAACGADLDPPMGQCRRDRGVIAFGFEQGTCECFNGGDPNVGCALVCTGEQDCSADRDTPFSFSAFNCSDYADLVSFVDNPDAIDFQTQQTCLVNLRDSTCNYWRGRCECATPYTAFNLLEQPIYFSMGSYRVSLMQGYDIDEYRPFTRYIDPGKSIIQIVDKDVLCWDPFVYPVIDSFVCTDHISYRNTDRTSDEDNMRCKDYTEADCGKTKMSDVVPADGDTCGENVLDLQSCMAYDELTLNVKTKTNSHQKIKTKLGTCVEHSLCAKSARPFYYYRSEWDRDEEMYTHPRNEGNNNDMRFFSGCDSARYDDNAAWPNSGVGVYGVYSASVCKGDDQSWMGTFYQYIRDYFTTCCRRMEGETLPNQCVPKGVPTDISPIRVIDSGFCEGEFEYITTIEECQYATDLLKMDKDSEYLKAVVDVGEAFEDIRGCYKEGMDMSFNAFKGVNYVTASTGKKAICKRKGQLLTSQSFQHQLKCDGDCNAVSFNWLLSEKFTGSSITGDGGLQRDCLVFEEETVYYNQDKISILDGSNYLIWDLEGEKTIFGVEITMDLVNIPPNWHLSSIYSPESIVISLYELNEDIDLDAAVVADWKFIRDIEVELKPDKPPMITVGGQCAGTYTAGGARTVLRYEHQAWNVKCDDAVGGVLPALSYGDPLYSANPAQACLNQCKDIGGFHLTPTFECECAPCQSTSNVGNAGDDFNVFHIIEVNEAEKNPLEIVGDWVSDGKRLHKNQKIRFTQQDCKGPSNEDSPRCERAISEEQCTNILSPNVACTEWRADDSICKINCIEEGPDCCDGSVDWPADNDWGGRFVENEHGLGSVDDDGTYKTIYVKDYECCEDTPSYVYLSDKVCLKSIYPYGQPPDSQYMEQWWYQPHAPWNEYTPNYHMTEIPPSFRLYSENKKEECAQRCWAAGLDEFIIFYVFHEKNDPAYTGRDYQRERCLCKSFDDCDGNRVDFASSGFPPDYDDDYFAPMWGGTSSNLFPLVAESYRIFNTCNDTSGYDHTDLSWSCPENYEMVESPNDFFDEVMFVNVLSKGDGMLGADSPQKFPGRDGYFKLYNSYTPNLLTHKCVYKERFEHPGFKTRFLKYNIFTNDYMHHSVKIKPLATAATIEYSEEKTGCMDDNHQVTFYNFMQTNFTKKRYACKYSILERDAKCTYATLYEDVEMNAIQCSEACGSAFHIEHNGAGGLRCYCDPMLCALRTAQAGAMSFMWEPDDCDITLLGVGIRCDSTVLVSQTGSKDIHECREFCESQGYTAFTTSGPDDSLGFYCNCCENDATTDIVSAGLFLPGDMVFRINNKFEAVDKFVKIEDKTCEHYGHQTIMDEETCKRAAIEFSGNPTDIFDDRTYGRCEELLPWEPVASVLDCAKRCEAFTVKYNDEWTDQQPFLGGTIDLKCKLQEVLYKIETTDLDECKTACSRDLNCNFLHQDATHCHMMSMCVEADNSLYPNDGVLTWALTQTLECGCSGSASGSLVLLRDWCTPNMVGFIGRNLDVPIVGSPDTLSSPDNILDLDYLDQFIGVGSLSGSQHYHVVPVDIDNDGDTDIFISQRIVPYSTSSDGAETLFYKNIGTATEGNWVLTTGSANPLDGIGCSTLTDGGPNPGCTWPVPCDGGDCCWDTYSSPCYLTFGDIDQDGDLDAVFARYTDPEYSFDNNISPTNNILTGTNLKDYYRNDGTPEQANFVHQSGSANNPFYNIVYLNEGYETMTPMIFDVDLDGLNDLVLGVPGAGTALGSVKYWRNTGSVGSPVFTEQTGASNPFDAIDEYIYSFSDTERDGYPEFFTFRNVPGSDMWRRGPCCAYTFESVPEAESEIYHTYTGRRTFGDLNGDMFPEMLVLYDPNINGWNGPTTYVMNLYTYHNHDETVITEQMIEAQFFYGFSSNWNRPLWPKTACATYCAAHAGFRYNMLEDTDATCSCSDDPTSTTPSTDHYMVYKFEIDTFESWVNPVELSPRGCSLNKFTEYEHETECRDCLCLEGDGEYTAPYVKVNAGTCESNGLITIGLRSRCFQAITELGLDVGTLPVDYFADNPWSEAGPLGCSHNVRAYFGDGTADCSSQTCICQRVTLYEQAEPGETCVESGLYPIKTWQECEAASIQFAQDVSMQYSQNAFNGCTRDGGITTLMYTQWTFSEGSLPGGFTGDVYCRRQAYPNELYTIIWNDINNAGEVCNANGYFPLNPANQDECELAAASLGLSSIGMHPVALGGFSDVSTFENAQRRGCTHSLSGFAHYSTTGDDICTPNRPCFCAQAFAVESRAIEPWFPTLPVAKYITAIDSKYVVIDEGSTCDTGFTTVGGPECDTARTFFPEIRNSTGCTRLCKHEAEQCVDGETCICFSNETVVVFNSTEQCAICGGGELFDVETSFFNENGDTRGCIYSPNSECSEVSVGWTQYFEDYSFVGNDSAYVVSSNFTGYCNDVEDIPGDYSNMHLSEVIDHCQRLCRSKAYFSIKRDECKCTSSCDVPIGSDEYTTFAYVTSLEILQMSRNEFLTRWDNVDPNIECFTDLNHLDRVDCQWIRALKHFARGGSYRVGDCHNLAPGVGTGVDSQIPCSGHGFLTGGTCACDYAQNIELKDTGVGVTFELPTLRQTPHRGKGCEIMCPGYDLNSMTSVCSGHGRCESDGRCACDQGYVGYKCHLSCEIETSDLTCSGHGVCNVIHAPVRPDILETILSLNCNRSVPEIISLSRDTVIKTGNIIYHMLQEGPHLLVNTYRTAIDTVVAFNAFTTSDYIVTISNDGVEGDILNDPEIRVCRLSTLLKTFEGNPLSIIDESGNFIINNMSSTGSIVLSAHHGTYTYFCTENPEMSGKIIIEECAAEESRNATIQDFYIKGEAYRRPFDTEDQYPYMACADTISVKREEAAHPLIESSTPDVYLDCALQTGFRETAYTVVCAECQCSFSLAAGHWTGYNCRTPALGYLGEDGRSSCPGMVEHKPCNGRGTCSWGSTDGLGIDIPVSANCFCGNPGNDTNFSIAPRNSAGDIMLHAESFGTPLYVDPIGIFEGNVTDCPEGLIPVGESECQFSKDGELTQLDAKIITSEAEYTLTDDDCVIFKTETNTEVINRVSASGDLVIDGTGQQFKCAGACFSHYKFVANGKIQSAVKMFHDLTGTFEEKTQKCGFACMNREVAISGPQNFNEYSVMGFSVSTEGECYCETEGPVILDADWRHFQFVIPYTENDDSGLCLLNNYLVYSNDVASVDTNPGQTPEKRLQMCARKCQLYRNGATDSVGFAYQETNAQCYCEGYTSGCTVANPAFRRFDFTFFNAFKHTENAECRCGRGVSSPSTTPLCFTTLNLPELDFPNTFPTQFNIQEPTLVYENFICRKDGNRVCKPGKFILNNYISDCNCKFGFSGPLCETPRMMCILGGTETDGTICDCGQNNIENLKQNPKGCCAYGMHWDQDRYSSFSPLQDFQEVPDNVFYTDALNSVCKPANFDAMQSPGEDTEVAKSLRQHNYVATTSDHEVFASTACINAREVSLYKAVYKYSTSFSDWATPTAPQAAMETTAPLDIFADLTVAHFSDHNAKMRCLDHCTTSTFINEKPSKSFVLNTVNKGSNFDASNVVGDANDLPYIFRCRCINEQAYVFDGMFLEYPLAWSHQKLSLSARPDTADSIDATSCDGAVGGTSNKGTYVSVLDFISGAAQGIFVNCGVGDYKVGGTPPTGETIRWNGVRYGIRVEADHSFYNFDSKVECSTRCAHEGFDTFWIWNNFYLDTVSYNLCQCIDNVDLHKRDVNGNWVVDIDTDQNNGPEMCSIHNNAEIKEACKRACYHGGFKFFNYWPDWDQPSAGTGSGATLNSCRCFKDTADCGSETIPALSKFTVMSSSIFSDTSASSLDNNEESVVGDVYDIVYPKETDNLDCVQTQNEILKHIDQQGLDGIDQEGNGIKNEIGIPYSIQPQSLTVKSVPASTLFEPGSNANFQMCYAYCSQQKQQLPQINSFTYVPKYKTIEMVFAGTAGTEKVPRCWLACNIDSDCEGTSTCQERSSIYAGKATGVHGCMEPTNKHDQYYGIPPIDYLGGSPTPPLGHCQGHCTSDSDCAGNLLCYVRSSGGGLQPVPGCDNTDIATVADTVNFCWEPGVYLDWAYVTETKVCGVSETEYSDTLECQCIEHDPEQVCVWYTQRVEKGECSVYKSLGLPFTSSDALFNDDKEIECRSRCLRLNSEMKAFMVHQGSQNCSCAINELDDVNYCKLQNNDPNYQVYDINLPFADKSCDEVDGFLMEMEKGLYTEPFAGSPEYDVRPANPLACNIESYLHIGQILDTAECECPLYGIEKMYQDTTNYINMPSDRIYNLEWMKLNMHYSQFHKLDTGSNLNSCKGYCNNQKGCVEALVDSSSDCWGLIYDPTFYNNIYPEEWVVQKISDAACFTHYDQPSTGTSFSSKEDCAVAAFGFSPFLPAILHWGVPRNTADDNLCWANDQYEGAVGWADNRMDPRTPKTLCPQTVGSGGFIPNAASNYEASGVADSDQLTPTYKVLKDGAFTADSTAVRAMKQLTNSQINRYCDLGETIKYNVTLTSSHANPHYCMQECRKDLMIGDEDFILSRANVDEDTFFCYCSETFYDNCALKFDSTFAQFKVHRYNGPFSSIERSITRRDPQVSNTKQCKCTGYYIFEGETFSCPENTFKNSGHCTSKCETCPQGQFAEIGSSICEKCPSGRILVGDICQKCDVGEFATALDNTCETCPIGRFNLLQGQGLCKACPAGWFDTDNSEGLNCFECPLGYSTDGDSGSATCEECAKGKYEDETGQPECKECDRGKYGDDVSFDDPNDCKLCDVTEYQNEKGKVSCKSCDSGLYSNTQGAPLCKECPPGQMNPWTGQDACDNCDSGQYQDEKAKTKCKKCDTGKAQPGYGRTSCETCDAGYYSGEGSWYCAQCALGKYQESSGQGSCTDCPALPGSITMNGVTKKYIRSSVLWDPSFRGTACDSVLESSAYTNSDFRNGAYANYDTFDCYKVSSNVNRQSKYIFARRFCWLNKDSNIYGTCNSMAKDLWNDASDEWTTYSASTDFNWCVPPQYQVKYDECSSIPCDDSTSALDTIADGIGYGGGFQFGGGF